MNLKNFFSKWFPFKENTLLPSTPPIRELDQQLKSHFKNLLLLQQALIHKSFTNENPQLQLQDNERLEFLGDAVLDLIISDCLMVEYPDYSEGDLSKFRAQMVSEQGLCKMAERYFLGRFLFLGKGEERSGGREKPSLLSNAYEAVVGALYLDQGFQRTKKIIVEHFSYFLSELEKTEFHQDYKTKLQEMVQNRFGISPKYVLVKETGPDHQKSFEISLKVKKREIGKGKGRNKKEAEQKAAKMGLSTLSEEVSDLDKNQKKFK